MVGRQRGARLRPQDSSPRAAPFSPLGTSRGRVDRPKRGVIKPGICDIFVVARKITRHEHERDERHPRIDGQCDPGARHGCGRAGEVRPSRPADGRGRHRHGPVYAGPEIRHRRYALARSRPFRSLGRAWLDAALRPALPDRRTGNDHRAAAKFPPARLEDAGPSGDSAIRVGSRRRRVRSARASPPRSAWRSPSAC